jgi:hypothetical protein
VGYGSDDSDIAVTKDMVKTIKRAAPTSESVTHGLPSFPYGEYLIRPAVFPLLLPAKKNLSYEDIHLRLVSERFDDLDLFPGNNSAEKADLLSLLVCKWTATTYKVVYSKMTLDKTGHPDWGVSLSSRKRKELLSPHIWRIEKPACVHFHWWYWPIEGAKDDKGRPVSGRRYEYKGFELVDSKQDDIRLYVNGVDTRKLFIVDFDDSIPNFDKLRAEWLHTLH